MAMQPKVLVLDEPTSQLDPIAASEFLSTIRKINLDLGITIIIIEHRLEEHYKGQEEIKEEVKYPEKKGKKLSKKEAVISVKEVWFRYEKEGKDIVRDLSLQVKKGELFCILGGNGTGKSTTLSLLSGIHRPYRGKIFLQGRDIRKISETVFIQQRPTGWQGIYFQML